MARRGNGARASSPSSLAPSAIPLLVFVAFCTRKASAEAIASDTSQPTFNYDDTSKWAKLQKDWAVCGSGTEQSPIDITKVEASKDLGPVKPTYKPGTATIMNRGHDFMMSFKGGNVNLVIKGKEYTLQKVHWHAPSEHTINGTGFDAEMHLVHEGTNKARAAISVLFSTKAGKPSKLLDDLGPYFKRLAGKENATEQVKGSIDPTTWIDEASGYYRYNGSLTTPPCTEGVVWTVMTKVADVSKEQVDMLKSVSKPPGPDARPVQEINKRIVLYYEASGSSDKQDKKGTQKKDEPEPKGKAATR